MTAQGPEEWDCGIVPDEGRMLVREIRKPDGVTYGIYFYRWNGPEEPLGYVYDDLEKARAHAWTLWEERMGLHDIK